MVDSEPLDPQKLLRTEKPLEEAVKFVQPFMHLPCEDIEAYLIAFDVYYRKKKVIFFKFGYGNWQIFSSL